MTGFASHDGAPPEPVAAPPPVAARPVLCCQPFCCSRAFGDGAPGRCPRIEVMVDERHADLAGVELASELLPDGRQVLLAFLVRGEDGGEALELGVWDVA